MNMNNPMLNQTAAQTLSEICLRYPDPLGLHQTISYENAVSLLVQAVQLSMRAPFVWGHIDRPAEGSVFLVFMVPQQTAFPVDGIRYQDQEQRYSISAGQGRELEICEIKYGFIPEPQDNSAFRVRRRFRLLKGGHPQLVLVHYSRGAAMPIVPSYLGQPVRSYPLRTINEPAMYVLGDKMGQKVYNNLPGNSQQPGPPISAGGSIGMNIGGMGNLGMQANHQAMLAQQNREMEALERRQQRERGASVSGHQPARVEEEDSGDEQDQISTQALALTRYKRNHEFMNEIFMHAALGDKKIPPYQSPYACFDLAQMEQKVGRLSEEVEELKAKAAARREARASLESASERDGYNEGGDVSMESLGAMPQGLTG